MRRLLLFPALLLIAAGAAPAAKKAPPPSPELDEALKDRVAEKPQSCISMNPQTGTRIIDGTAIIYQESSRLWYVNRPSEGRCPSLRHYRILVTRAFSSQLCRGDLVEMVEPSGSIPFGYCILGDFTPYRKVKPDGGQAEKQ
ncbi:hypothetical protein CLG96_10265 [Sphingomonas oleivorans]|uniref:Uncharacterized protein n=1 Tax=Sphingomonas oleivorans TaxID=1735121 RepID=A0A2T5FXC3_9SPHN|nr:hypothetical protein [Sphingomonas oleivorans]PTQ10780.1 hypothetical protein CLG96_10265 [Sphingomonas oleivorans]